MVLDLGLVQAGEVTSASVHDNRGDLSEPGEVVIRDKGNFGVEPRRFDATFKRVFGELRLSRSFESIARELVSKVALYNMLVNV